MALLALAGLHMCSRSGQQHTQGSRIAEGPRSFRTCHPAHLLPHAQREATWTASSGPREPLTSALAQGSLGELPLGTAPMASRRRRRTEEEGLEGVPPLPRTSPSPTLTSWPWWVALRGP